MTPRLLAVGMAFFAGFSIVFGVRVTRVRGEEKAQQTASKPELTYRYTGRHYPENEVQAMSLEQKVKEAMNAFDHCEFSTKNTPWVLVHAMLAGGKDLTVIDKRTGGRIKALDYLTDARLRPHDVLFLRGSHGVQVKSTAIRHLYEDHTDQFLMYFSQAGVPESQPIYLSASDKATVGDLLNSAMQRVDNERELTWTLPALVHYLPPSKRWRNNAGRVFSGNDLAAMLLHQGIDWGTCFGTHTLYGLAYAMNEVVARSAAAPPVWKHVRNELDHSIVSARKFQNADGSFAVSWTWASQEHLSSQLTVNVTGHVLEWLAMAATDSDFTSAWLSRACDRLSTVIMLQAADRMEVAALTHAIHGLRLYASRRFA